jgi:hypothetical protein
MSAEGLLLSSLRQLQLPPAAPSAGVLIQEGTLSFLALPLSEHHVGPTIKCLVHLVNKELDDPAHSR